MKGPVWRSAYTRVRMVPSMPVVFNHSWYKTPYTSGSQPGCRGTQGCREEVSGVPPNIEFTTFLIFLLLRVLRIVILARVRVPPNFFQSYRVPWTKKGWKTLPYTDKIWRHPQLKLHCEYKKKQYLTAPLAPPEGIMDANGNHCNRLKSRIKAKTSTVLRAQKLCVNCWWKWSLPSILGFDYFM